MASEQEPAIQVGNAGGQALLQSARRYGPQMSGSLGSSGAEAPDESSFAQVCSVDSHSDPALHTQHISVVEHDPLHPAGFGNQPLPIAEQSVPLSPEGVASVEKHCPSRSAAPPGAYVFASGRFTLGISPPPKPTRLGFIVFKIR